MFNRRVPTLFALFLAPFLALSLSAVSGDKAPERLPAPFSAYLTAASPGRLVAVADKLFLAVLQDTKGASGYQPGLFPSLAKQLNIPSLFDNSDADLGIAAILDDNPQFAITLAGVDTETLIGELERSGLGVTGRGDGYMIDASPIAGGLSFYLAPLDDARLLICETTSAHRRFKGMLADYAPRRPANADVRLVVDVRRLLDTYPEVVEGYLEDIQSMGETEIEASLSENLDPKFRANLARAVSETVRRFAPLPLEVDAASLDLRLDGDLLELGFALAAGRDTALGGLSRKYARQGNPEYSLAGAVSDDALVLSASSPEKGDLFEEGDLCTTVASTFFDALVPGRAGDAENLREELRDNPVSEAVSGYYVVDGALMRVKFARVDHGKSFIQSMVDGTELANALLEQINANMPSRNRVSLVVDDGKAGSLAYTRIAPHLELYEDDPDADLEATRDAINSLALYVAGSNDAMVMVSGLHVDADMLRKEADKAENGVDNALMDYSVSRDVMRRLTKRQIGHGLFKPSEIFVYLAWYRLSTGILSPDDESFDADEYLESLKNGGALAGYSLGAVPGGLTFQLVLPLVAINDLFVNIEKEQGLQ